MRKVRANIECLGPQEADRAAADVLSVSTFNLWFSTLHQRTRHEAVLALLAQKAVQLMAFQEVTSIFVDVLAERTKQAHNAMYWVEDGGAALGHYGVGILSCVRPLNAWFMELPSAMGRCLLAVELETPVGRFTFATVHLESLDNEAMRARQLALIFEALEDQERVVLTGDFNLCGTWRENDRIDERYTDLWTMLEPEASGWTEDTVINTMLLNKRDGRAKQVRFDRILLRDDHADRATPRSIDRLGTEPIAPGVFLSDHFGLFAVMEP